MNPSSPRPVLSGLLLLGLIFIAPASRSISVAEVVKAFCLSAYQSDLHREGKVAPAAQLERTCACVGDRVANGSDVEEANEACGRTLEQRSVSKPRAPH
jgi:hypothetical protein